MRVAQVTSAAGVWACRDLRCRDSGIPVLRLGKLPLREAPWSLGALLALALLVYEQRTRLDHAAGPALDRPPAHMEGASDLSLDLVAPSPAVRQCDRDRLLDLGLALLVLAAL